MTPLLPAIDLEIPADGLSIGGIRVIVELSRREQLARTQAHLRAISAKIAAYENVAAEGDPS